MPAGDARPVPRKNTAFRLYFAVRNSTTGALITSWTGADSEVSLDGGSFADCTNEATEIGTSGCGFIDLTSSEMNADAVVYKLTLTNSNALPLVLTLFPEEAGDYRGEATTVSDKTGYTVSTVSDKTGYSLASGGLASVTAWTVAITGNITGNLSGSVSSVTNRVTANTDQLAGQTVTASAGVTFPTSVASPTNITAGTITTVSGNVNGNVAGSVGSVTAGVTVSTIGANVITASSIASGAFDDKGNWLKPTVAGRTLDVTATGAAGIDWGNVENQSASVFLANTTVQLVDSVDNVGFVSLLNSGAITADSFAPDAITSTGLAASAANKVRDSVWNATLSSYTTAGTAGLGLSDLLSRVTSTVKGMWDNLVAMITGSGASAKYTTTALENAPAGGGGGGGTDWTANERTAIRSILGIPASGTTPEDPTVGILDTIRDKTNLITSGSVSTALPVTSQGQLTGPLYIGDDYLNANGRAFAWTVALPTGYVAGTSTCKFGMAYEDDSGSYSFSVTGTVIDAGSGNVTLRFDVPKATTSTLAAGWYRWSVEHTAADGTEITRIANAANKLVEWREKLT